MAGIRVAAALALAVGCGTNRPEIPPELLEPGVGCGDSGYPAGPYGTEPGAVIANVCFRGWRSPASTPHSSASLEDVSFSSFYDPTGQRYELLLINSAALWCTACTVEHRTLPDRHREFAPLGLAILSALFQDGDAEPATVDDLTLWVETFATPFPMALDPEYQLGSYASAESAPLNLLVDTRNMRILEKVVGDGSGLWSLVREELDRRASE